MAVDWNRTITIDSPPGLPLITPLVVRNTLIGVGVVAALLVILKR